MAQNDKRILLTLRRDTTERVAEADDVSLLKELLLWAREKRIVLGHIEIGEVAVTVTDLGMEAPKTVSRKKSAGALYREFAGDHADELKDAGLDDDDEPAVQ